jgi:hypothetical protein
MWQPLSGGANQFAGGSFTRWSPAPFHGALLQQLPAWVVGYVMLTVAYNVEHCDDSEMATARVENSSMGWTRRGHPALGSCHDWVRHGIRIAD